MRDKTVATIGGDQRSPSGGLVETQGLSIGGEWTYHFNRLEESALFAPTAMQRLFRFVAFVALMLAREWAHGGVAGAQEPSAPRVSSPVGRADDDLRYLHGPDGRLIPVPDKASYDRFLDWLDATSHPGPPRFAITRLRLEGVALDERVQLTARIEVVVNVEGEWVLVPLGMPEAQMTAVPEYAGAGEQSPSPFDATTGLGWWLRGKGKHELTLPLSAPARFKAPQRRLQLTLPQSAITTCRLTVDAPRVSAKASDRARVTTRASGNATELEVVGIDNRLDLTWQSLAPVNTSPPLLEVNTAINLTLVEVEGAAVEATQRIQALGLQGSFERLQVRLPMGTQLLRLEGPDYQEHHVVEGYPDRIEIRLKKSGPGPFELRYALHAPFPPPGEPFVLDGFDVEAASVQSGYVAVTVVGDLRAMRDVDDERFVHRVNISDLPSSLRQPQTSLAFQFFKRLKLPLRFEPVAPLASVEPETTFVARPGLIELVSAQRLQIRRGSLGRLTVRWPRWKSSGWSAPTFELAGGGDFRIADGADSAADAIQLEFTEPLTGNVSLLIRSQRPLVDPTEQFETSLPACDVPIAHPATVTWYSSEDLQVAVDATPGTTLRLAATLSRPTPAEASGLARRGEQVIEPPTGTILAQVVRREREASAVCHVQVRLEDRVALVTQRFDLEVAFAPLEELRLVVPSVLAETPIELTAGDVGAVAVKTDRRTGDWVIPVEPSRTGRLTWTARFALELPGASDLDAFTTLPVPLIACATAEVQSVQLSLQDAAGAPVAAVGGDWRRQLAPAGDPVWIHEGAVEVISVSLPEAATRRSLELIPRAWLRTIVGTDGSIRMRAQYRVAAGVRELPFRLPATWRPTAAWWGRQTVSTRFPAGADAAEGDWLIVAPAGIDSAVALVTVEIEAPVVEITALGIELRLTAPQLPADRLPAETVWQVIVPEDQHLVIRPEVFAPAYRWQRSGFVWKRQSQFSDAELQAWVGATAGPAPFNPHAEGKSYLFRTSRGAATIELQFVKELPLLFAGAGGTLLAGLLLLRVKRLRTLPVAVAAAALVAVASIGWTEAVLTLLQPILLGAGLLLFYKLIDSLASRGISAEPVARVTLPGQSSTVVPAPFVPPGSHDYTAVRTTFPYVGSAAGAPEPGSRS